MFVAAKGVGFDFARATVNAIDLEDELVGNCAPEHLLDNTAQDMANKTVDDSALDDQPCVHEECMAQSSSTMPIDVMALEHDTILLTDDGDAEAALDYAGDNGLPIKDGTRDRLSQPPPPNKLQGHLPEEREAMQGRQEGRKGAD